MNNESSIIVEENSSAKKDEKKKFRLKEFLNIKGKKKSEDREMTEDNYEVENEKFATNNESVKQDANTLPEQQEEEEQESSTSIEVVADGALCQCSSNPNPAYLNVISQQKLYCNNGSVLAATTLDNTVASIDFKNCPTKYGPPPCAAVIKWENYYEDLDILGSLKILTMESQGTCSLGGTISFQTSGQTQTVKIKTGDITHVESISADMPMMASIEEESNNKELQSEIDAESGTQESTETDAQEENPQEEEVVLISTSEIVESTGLVESIQAITYKNHYNGGILVQPLQVNCTFQAVKAGTVTWRVRDEDMKILIEKRAGNTITVKFPSEKRYVIEAFKSSSYVKDDTTIDQVESSQSTYQNALLVKGTKNGLKLIAKENRVRMNVPVEILHEKWFSEATIEKGIIEYQVFKNGTPVEAEKYNIESLTDSMKITFAEDGNYVIAGTSNKGCKIEATEQITVERLKVTGVTVNGKSDIKLRPGEALSLTCSLNFEDADKSQVKWIVDYSQSNSPKNAKEVYPATKAVPPQNIFTKEGCYFVYAFFNGKTSSIKAIVNIAEACFENVQWKDANDNTILQIGKREKIKAHITMKAVGGLVLRFELNATNQDRPLAYWKKSIPTDKDDIILDVQLIDYSTQKLSHGDSLFLKVYQQSTGKELKQNVPFTSFPITYNTQEQITSLKVYKDKECTNTTATVTYGDSIYVRVLTRNLTGESLELHLYRKYEKSFLWIDYSKEKKLIKVTEKVDSEGSVVFEVKTNKDWQSSGESDSYIAIVTEKDDRYFKERGISNWEKNETAKNNFTIGRDLALMQFVNEQAAEEGGESITKISKAGSNSKDDKCDKCKLDLTLETLKKITTISASYECRVVDMLPYLNDYMEKFGINKTCYRRAHFLGQIAKETKFYSLFEDLNHTKESLKSANFPNRETIIKHGYYKKDGVISKEDEIRMGNIGYGTGKMASGLGNTPVAEKDWADPTKDGYKYRGRGLIQLTGKYNYQKFQEWYNKKKNEYGWKELNFADNPDLLSVKEKNNKISNPEMMVLTAIYFWDKNNMNILADEGQKKYNTDKISNVINRNQEDKIRMQRYKLFIESFLQVRDNNQCILLKCNKVSIAATDILTYHIHANGRNIVKQIPVQNNHPGKCRYIYHDKSGIMHTIADLKVKKVSVKKESTAPKPVDGKVELIDDIRDFEGYTSADGKIKAKVNKWDSTQQNRWYINPECFAAILGAMLDLNIEKLIYRGSSTTNGNGGESVTHYDGVATDIAYFATDERTSTVLLEDEKLDLQLNIDFIDALIDYGYVHFDKFYTQEFIPYGQTTKRFLIKGMGTCYTPPHNNHLHIGGFDFRTVIVKEDTKKK